MLSGSPIDPSVQFAPVTPTDNKQLTYHGKSASAKAFYIGGAGNLAIQDDTGTSVVFIGVIAGVIYPISSNVVMATGTTASNIIALF